MLKTCSRDREREGHYLSFVCHEEEKLYNMHGRLDRVNCIIGFVWNMPYKTLSVFFFSFCALLLL